MLGRGDVPLAEAGESAISNFVASTHLVNDTGLVRCVCLLVALMTNPLPSPPSRPFPPTALSLKPSQRSLANLTSRAFRARPTSTRKTTLTTANDTYQHLSPGERQISRGGGKADSEGEVDVRGGGAAPKGRHHQSQGGYHGHIHRLLLQVRQGLAYLGLHGNGRAA